MREAVVDGSFPGWRIALMQSRKSDDIITLGSFQIIGDGNEFMVVVSIIAGSILLTDPSDRI